MMYIFIYINIFMFLLPFWKLTCKYLLLNSFKKKKGFVFPLVLVLVSFACVPGVVDEEKEVKV